MEGVKEPPISREIPRSPEQLPVEVIVRPWEDPVISALGFGPRSMYIENCWLPVLGPTASWLYRRLGSWAEYNADGVKIDMADLSASLGLGDSLGRHSKLARALDRLVRFDAARWAGTDELQVRTALPPLPLRLSRRLGYTAARLHEEYVRQPRGAIEGRQT